MCHEHRTLGGGVDQEGASRTTPSDSILVAVPSRDDKKIEVYRLPEERLVHVAPKVQIKDTGMFDSCTCFIRLSLGGECKHVTMS